MLQIEIKPEDVNKYVVDAILKSALGNQLTEAINKGIEDCMSGYSSPVKKLIETTISEHIKNILTAEPWRTKIHQKITDTFTEEAVENMVSYCAELTVKRIKEGYE